MKSFKDFITERRGLYVHYNQQADGTYERRKHRHEGIDADPFKRQPKNVSTVPEYVKSKKIIKNGPISQQDAEEIAKTHGINLSTMDEKGKVLRGTKPQEILLRNPNKRSPFPFIKKVI